MGTVNGEPAPRSTPRDLAYVIYTSGSTGLPKGAMVEQRGMLNHLYAKVQDLALTAEDSIAQTASQSFDISVWQFLSALLVGGRVHIFPNEIATDPRPLLVQTEEQQITILEVVPSVLRMMLEEIAQGTRPKLTQLRWLIPTGEALPPNLCRRWFAHYSSIPMLNAYGPTECSDDVTHYPIFEPPSVDVFNMSIGRPVANMQMYILDSHMQPVPIGVPGELYVGGVGVGRGYLHDPDRTAEAFLQDPFASSPESKVQSPKSKVDAIDSGPWTLDLGRLYKTGDKARYLPDGNIEFMGRLDYQVKIRGFRIELGEIEAVLDQHPDVNQNVVIDFENRPGHKQLVAYVVTNDVATDDKMTMGDADIIQSSLHPVIPSSGHSFIQSELHRFLADKLPDYMIPAAFVMLDEIPLTPNGKIDRKALPAPDVDPSTTAEVYSPPRTPTEETLVELWANVLDREQTSIGIHHNFFALGGHSLLATQVVSRIRQTFQVELSVRRLFEAPSVVELGEQVELAMQRGQSLDRPAIQPRPEGTRRNENLPLSFAQERLWFLDQLEGEHAIYNMPAALRIEGALDVTALEQSLSEIVRRHEVLRTNFLAIEGAPVQVIAAPELITIPIVDLQHLVDDEQNVKVLQLADEESERPFDLTDDRLVRLTLLLLEPEVHVLLLTMHHIISDGWSIEIFVQEATALYTAFSQGEPSPLTDLTIQYADYAHWQRQWLQGEVLERELAYWHTRLADAPPLLELPTDRPRPAVQTFEGGEFDFDLDTDLMAQLQQLSQQAGTTMFMTLLAAFDVLLARYSGQDDIVVGTPIAGRTQQETEPLIGFFVNTLLLRTDLSADPTFWELLTQVRQVTLDAYTHQDVPFARLVEELQPERNLSHTPLYQVMFLFQAATADDEDLPGLTITSLEDGENVTANDDDLLLAISETEDGLDATIEYNRELFDEATIQRMANHFENLLRAIVATPEQRVSVLPLLSTEERQQILVEWNKSQVDFGQDGQCFHQIFESQVVQTPNATAVLFEGQHLTYAELNIRANGIAHQLRAQGVGLDVVVALLTERSPDFLAAVLAIFKAGGAYLPLNPHAPAARQGQVLTQSRTPLLLTIESNREVVDEILAGLQGEEQPRVLLIEDLKQQDAPTANLPIYSQASDLAYVIYTSGSTGLPKGAMVEQRGMINHLYAKIQDLDLGAGDTVAQTAPQSFDISVWQFLSALLVGGRVHIFPDEIAGDPVQLLTQTEQEAITILEVVPSLMRMMLEEVAQGQRPGLSKLRWLIPTGEALPPNLCRQWLAHYPAIPLINAYGPTECSDDVTHYAIHEPPAADVLNMPIGYPVANMQMYILDSHMPPVPIGVAGELYVGGIGVGRGYLFDPDRTAEAFVQNPFISSPKSKVQSRRVTP
ncbi:amino acid adenylation domain-containing protein [Chloroflexi bacterium TSY]|nr:amino acid adenylation domain-containing protein [Chloroflexi bacterium TSY]